MPDFKNVTSSSNGILHLSIEIGASNVVYETLLSSFFFSRVRKITQYLLNLNGNTFIRAKQ